MPVWVGSHCLVGFLQLLLQPLAMPYNPSPVFPAALLSCCVPSLLHLQAVLDLPSFFSPLSLADLKSINTTLSAHLRVENTRSYPRSPWETSPSPFATQRAANTSRRRSSSPRASAAGMPHALWFISETDLFCISVSFLVWCLMKTPTAKWNFSHFDSQLCKSF